MKIKIKPFSKYILRTPAYPLVSYLNLLDEYNNEKRLCLLEDNYFREAIRIASPELLAILDKYKNAPSSLSKEKSDALYLTVLKYTSRIASRCTPFGLFAGCSVGEFKNESVISLTTKEHFGRVTQFDMHYWVALLQELANRKEVRNYLTYYPNTTIYSLSDFYRYIEYKYVATKREHSITAIRKSRYLETLLEAAKKGITIPTMINLLASDESEKEEALDFINELIDSQFLVSELDASITGCNEWERITTILSKVPLLEKEKKLLTEIKAHLLSLDANVVPEETTYTSIKNNLVALNLAFEEKYLFQTDMNVTTIANQLNTSITQKTLQAITFCNGIKKHNQSGNQAQFIKAFTNRYEAREMPLATVLDTESGIGYIQNSNQNDSHPLLAPFHFSSKSENTSTEKWDAIDFILEKKLREALTDNRTEIQLSEKDFPDFNSNWEDCPATFSAMIEVLKKDNQEVLFIDSAGGMSAAKLLARFCNGNKAINSLTKEIIQKENNFYDDMILAEIVHIPEARIGNIIKRPILREYEIPYLANAGVDKQFQISIEDLMVSVKNNTIILRSKKHNKRVLPCLSNAHNYGKNALPIYHFLCDLQLQEMKPFYSFGWGNLESHYTYFPRVTYKDVILSKEKWIFKKEDLAHFYTFGKEFSKETFIKWKISNNIPSLVNWVHYDNTLLLDFDKEISIQLFLKSVKSFDTIVLEEFIFNDNLLVKNTIGEGYTNQVILSFYKEKVQND